VLAFNWAQNGKIDNENVWLEDAQHRVAWITTYYIFCILYYALLNFLKVNAR